MGSTAKIPIGDPRKYSHADCFKPSTYKHFESKYAAPNVKQDEKNEEKVVDEKPPQNQIQNFLATSVRIEKIGEVRTATNTTLKETRDALESTNWDVQKAIKLLTPPTVHPTVSTPTVNVPKTIQESTSTDHFQFDDLRKLIHARLDTYLGGAAGSGKSHAIASAAKSFGLRYEYIALSDATMPSYIFGYQTANGDYVPTTFYDFYRNGGVLDIAELDNANTNVFTLLNNALDNGHCTFPGRSKDEPFQLVMRHENFITVGNGNTFLRGPDAMFPARQRQDAASIERFIFINWKYDERLERALVLGTPLVTTQPFIPENIELSLSTRAKIVDWAHALRKICSPGASSVQGEKLVVSMRGIKKLTRLMEIGFSSSQAVRMAIFKEYAETEKLLKLVPLTF